MIKIGVLFDRLDQSEVVNAFVRSANNLLESRSDMEIIAFCGQQGIPTERPLFAAMNMTEMYLYSCVGIATSLATASKLLRMPGPKAKFFFDWNLEWTKGEARSYESLNDIYLNQNLELICKSFDDMNVIMDSWNRGVAYVLDSFNLKTMVECMEYDREI